MQSEHQVSNNVALKEWAVVCAALANGTQQLLFRKGGIHEGAGGFQPEHREFWLYPTGFHQSAEGVRLENLEQALRILHQQHAADVIPIQHYCRVRSVHWIEQKSLLMQLRPYHVLTDEAVTKRFEYRRPGVYVMVVETLLLPEPHWVKHDPVYDGCHSWVELNASISTSSLSACDASRNSDRIAEVEIMLQNSL